MADEIIENPIKELRNELGLGQVEFALLLGVHPSNVGHHETGHATGLQRAMRAGLDSIGFDSKEIAKRYAIWRDQKRKRLLKRLQATKKLEVAVE